ncbi:tryptophan synthase subunit alpha [Peribacillus saganii]|uniref:Tryptophan synthase alpha chain n=1 Tax=Peribacillus saganii TaxID=2303992 RepID=A0A372LTJ5_9BACI|nr:tryptophan synthase subunit alpha [Peribacillus saganii]RFU71122.1 tryptophan synthase subunit alpha [Peribacillus saganii]
MGKQKIQEAFAEVETRGEKAFIPYIMAGDGGFGKLKEELLFFENAGATVVELGIPFSDPVADGPTIQKAGQRALEQGTTLELVLKHVKEIRKEVKIPIVLMTYLNPVFAYGIPRFAEDCKAAGVDGCIIPDLPFEEEQIISGHLAKSELALIRLVTLTSSKDRIAKLAESAEGFLYAVTITGITGARDSFSQEVTAYLKQVKELSPIPVLAGFGISTPEHVTAAIQACDGVIVGSRIIDLIEKNDLDAIKELIHASKKSGITLS